MTSGRLAGLSRTRAGLIAAVVLAVLAWPSRAEERAQESVLLELRGANDLVAAPFSLERDPSPFGTAVLLCGSSLLRSADERGFALPPVAEIADALFADDRTSVRQQILVAPCLVEAGLDRDDPRPAALVTAGLAQVRQRLAEATSADEVETAAADFIDLAVLVDAAGLAEDAALPAVAAELRRRLPADSVLRSIAPIKESAADTLAPGAPLGAVDAYYRALAGDDDPGWLREAWRSTADADQRDVDLMTPLILIRATRLTAARTGAPGLVDELGTALRRYVGVVGTDGGWILENNEIRGTLRATFVAAMTAAARGLPVRSAAIADALGAEDLIHDEFEQAAQAVALGLVDPAPAGEPPAVDVAAWPLAELLSSQDAVLLALLYAKAGGPVVDPESLAGQQDSATPAEEAEAAQQVAFWIGTRQDGRALSDTDRRRFTARVADPTLGSAGRYLAHAALAVSAGSDRAALRDSLRDLDAAVGDCGSPDWLVRASVVDGLCNLPAGLSAVIAETALGAETGLLDPVVTGS